MTSPLHDLIGLSTLTSFEPARDLEFTVDRTGSRERKRGRGSYILM